MKKTLITASIALAAATASWASGFNPPLMGWSTWNTFAGNINEQLIESQADAMVKTGLKAAGYKYINIDDGYWVGRGNDGVVRVNTERFPHGMAAVAKYIHSLGLKAGIYSDAGDNTCMSGSGKYPGGIGVGLAGHEEQDLKLYFDDWGYDFIKVDFCGGSHMKLNEQQQYTKISNAIKACNKKDVRFNICRWAFPGTWAASVADSWRTTGDIQCNWASLKQIIGENLYLQAFTGNGHYNDADMLEMGRTLSHDEETTHMAYWCIMSSPLVIGCDMTTIPSASLNLLTNKDLIAMNQDRLGIGAPVVQREANDVYVVAKDMKQVFGKQRAVVVMNLSDSEKTIQMSIDALGFAGKVKVHDCITNTNLDYQPEGSLFVDIPAHGSRAFFIYGKRVEKTIYQAEEAWLKAYQELNNGVATPVFAASPKANLGIYVAQLGGTPDNYLEWRNVYSENGGAYDLKIRYASKDARNLDVAVNGKQVKQFTGLNTASDADDWKTVTVSIALNKGENSIKLSNATAAAPNIDCITISRRQ